MVRLLQTCFIFVLLFNCQKLSGQNIDFNLRYNETDDRYEVYALPDVSNPTYFVGGGSQISLVLPASIADFPLIISTVNGGIWTDNSRIFAPVVTPTVDYHAVASSGSFISLIGGQELLLFTFQLTPSGCIEGPRIFENGSDPQSNAPGMAGGDFNNFFPNLFTFQDGYNANYNNDGILCAAPPSIIYAPDTTYQELDTTIVMDVITMDDSSMELDSTLKYSLLGIDSALFAIDSITGEITFINTPDYENPMDADSNNVYNINVVVCEAANPSFCDTQAVAITVINDYNDDGIRLLCVNSINDQIQIKNFGSDTVDISAFRLCSKFAYTNNGLAIDMNLLNGAFNLAPGDTLILDGFSLDNAADLGLYAPTGAFSEADALLDFTQWGSGGNGRESVAVTKGIWNVGDFRMDIPEYCYIGDGTENGVSFWQGRNPPLAIIDRVSTGENIPLIIDVQVNDLDYLNDGLVTTIIGMSTQGVSPTILNNDSLDYTPPTNFIGVDTITYAVCYQDFPMACDTAIVLLTIAPDSDNDGIADDKDLDDDNDGIPDLVECPFVEVEFTLNPAISDSTKLIYEAMIHGNLETVTITPSTNPKSLLDANNQVSPNGAVLSTSLSEPIAMRDDSITEAALTFTPSIPIQSIRLEELSDMDRQTGDFPTDAFGFTVNGFWTMVTGDLASYDPSTQQLITNNPDGTAEPTLTATNNSAHEMVQKGVVSPILVRGTIGETNNAEVVFTTFTPFTEIDLIVEDLSLLGARELIDNRSIVAFITVGVPLCDIDGDNIPNYLDLDSDGDGCTDAEEAGHLVPQQIDSTIAGPYGVNGLADNVETNVDSDTLNYMLFGTVNNPEFLDSLASSGCNEAPIITFIPTINYNDGNTNVVVDVMSTDDTNSELDSTLTYSLIGIDSALFTIDSLTGVINFVNPPSVDNPLDDGMDNVYNIEVIVCDEGRIILCDTQAIVITIAKDNDGDGIADIFDLDDDNDGILDWDECVGTDVTFTYDNSLSDNTKLVYTAIIDGNLETVTLTASTNAQSLLNPVGIIEPNGTTLTPNGGNGIVNLRDDATMEAALTFTASTPIVHIKFIDLDDMDRKLGDLPSDAFGFTTTGYWEIVEGNLASYDAATGNLIVNNPNGDATSNLSDVEDSGFEMLNKNAISGVLTRGTIGETNNAKANFIASAPFLTTDMLSEDLSLDGNRELVTSNFILQFLTVGIPDCDPDMDGIPNYFDLDADGDGCPDAIEAGHGITMQVDSTIAGPYGNNGVADTIETSDTQTAFANYMITETDAGTYAFLDNTISEGCTQPMIFAENDMDSVVQDQTITIDILSNDSSQLTIIDASNIQLDTPINGSVTLNPDGTIEYTPTTSFSGIDTLQYIVCDTTSIPNTICDTAMVFITVLADSDGDGVPDIDDLDDDNDGILDIIESLGFDPSTPNSCSFPKANFSADSVTQVIGTSGAPFVGDAYRFRNVISINAIPLDAVITITAADANITTFTIDNDGTGDPAAWQAEYDVPAGEPATMEFEIVFTVANTNSVVPLDRFGGIFNDIDGANANESITLEKPGLYAVEDSTELSVTTSPAGDVTFQGPVFTYPGIVLNTDIAAYFTYFNINSFKFSTTGNNVTANPNTNFFSLVFDVCAINTFSDIDYFINFGVDTDLDMIGDELDSDSDDDGCFDAVEATGNFELTTDVDPVTGQLLGGVDPLTGIPLSAGSGQSSHLAVVTNGPDTDNDGIADACDPVDDRSDWDNDGVLDVDDLDDDNDGILDADEGGPACSNSVISSINTKMSGGVLAYQLNQDLSSQFPLELNNGAYLFNARFVDGAGDTGTPSWQNGVQIRADQGPTIGDYLYMQPVMVGQVASGDYVEYEFTFPTPLDQFNFRIGGLNNGDYSEITAFSGATPITITPDNFSEFNPSPGNWEVAQNRVIGHNVGGGTDVTINFVTVTIPGPVSRVVIASGRGNNTDGSSTTAIHTVVGCLPSTGQNSDNDTIPDYLDLDSDGDGCPDANEAGHEQLVQADSTIIGPFGANGLAASVENSDSDTATINYTINETNTGIYDFLDNTLQTGCDQITTLMLKVMLQGAILGSPDSLMRADLNSQNFIPLLQPYTSAFNTTNRFTHVGGGNETTTALILNANVGTPDALVDWVFVELRDPMDSTSVFQTIAALVQRDGDVVDAATGEPIILMNPPLSFFVSVKHRNHLGAMKNSPVLTMNDTATIDFTTMALSEFFTQPGYENLAVTTESGKRVLWAANSNKDIKSKYDGAANDRIIIGNEVLTAPLNIVPSLNYANTLGYFQGDINMDGLVKYDGTNNDQIFLQNIVITYPLNFNNLMINNFNNLVEQLP